MDSISFTKPTNKNPVEPVLKNLNLVNFLEHRIKQKYNKSITY